MCLNWMSSFGPHDIALRLTARSASISIIPENRDHLLFITTRLYINVNAPIDQDPLILSLLQLPSQQVSGKLPEQRRMLIFPGRRLLDGAAQGDERGLSLQLTEQADAYRTTLRIKAMGKDEAGVTCKIGHEQLVASKGWCNDHIKFLC